MTDVVLLRYEVEPGETDRLREWLADLAASEDEAVDLLRAEGMYTESLFVEERADGPDHLLWYMEAADVDAVMTAYDAVDADLADAFDALAEEVLVGGMEGIVAKPELVVHAVNPDRPADQPPQVVTADD